MPYPDHSVSQAQQIKTLYLTVKARADANKNILKAGPLKKNMEDIGKQFADQLASDIAGIRHNAVEHFQKVDGWLASATTSLKRAQEAHARWEQAHQDHDAEIVLAAEPFCGHLAEVAVLDSREFGQSWAAYRGFNCGEVAPKYCEKFRTTRQALMEESKGFVTKIARISAVHHEALTLKNLHLSSQHANDHNIMAKQGAAAELFRSIEHMYTTSFTGLNTVQNAAQNCETISGWAHNPRLEQDGELKGIDSIFINLSNLRKGYTQALASMQRTYETGVRQFQGEDLHDEVIKHELERSRALVADTRQKFQFVENGYKNAMSDMTKIRGILKK
jgi:hypothetical protein